MVELQSVDVAQQLSPWEPGILSLAVFGIIVLGLMGALLFLSARLNPARRGAVPDSPYECGLSPVQPALLRHQAAFYLVAMFFLIFDVEAVYIFSWAVSFDADPATWWRMAFFILMLLAGLVYVWRKGGLEWGPTRKG